MDESIEGRVSIKIADGKPLGPYVLPTWNILSAGRTSGYGLHIPNRWIPNKLCRFLPFELGWVVQVGPSPRMRVEDKYVGEHVFAPRSMLALQEGKTRLSFPELDDYFEMAVVIGPGAAADHAAVHDTVTEDDPRRMRTEFAVRRVVMTPKQRGTVATVFEYLIKGEPKPHNLTAAAAAKLGVTEQPVKNVLTKVRDKVNVERWGPAIEGYEPLGHYLVTLTRNVTWEDLPQHLQ